MGRDVDVEVERLWRKRRSNSLCLQSKYSCPETQLIWTFGKGPIDATLVQSVLEFQPNCCILYRVGVKTPYSKPIINASVQKESEQSKLLNDVVFLKMPKNRLELDCSPSSILKQIRIATTNPRPRTESSQREESSLLGSFLCDQFLASFLKIIFQIKSKPK